MPPLPGELALWQRHSCFRVVGAAPPEPWARCSFRLLATASSVKRGVSQCAISGPARHGRYFGRQPEHVLRSAYQAFNDRDIETALELMHADVDCPNAWEGGRVLGRAAVREYWERQFAAISSDVQPERFTSEPDGSVTAHVHQVVHDASTHELLSDAHVRHRYRLETGLILRMDVLPE